MIKFDELCTFHTFYSLFVLDLVLLSTTIAVADILRTLAALYSFSHAAQHNVSSFMSPNVLLCDDPLPIYKVDKRLT